MKPLLLSACLMLSVLAACDSENVSWAFVSNPGGPGGGAVIVIRYTSLEGAGSTSHAVQLSGTDSSGAVTLWLLAKSDTAVLERPGEVELRTPLLGSARRLRGAATTWLEQGPVALRIDVADASAVDGQALGRGRLHIAAGGNLAVLEHDAGVNVYQGGVAAERLPPTHRFDPSTTDLRLILPDLRIRTLVPPLPPRPEQRLTSNTSRGSVRLLGPAGEALAEIPQGRVEMFGGRSGLFLTARFEQGVSSKDPTPMTLYMAEHNRYLARVEMP